MNQPYLIINENGPLAMAHTQASAMNAMYHEAAKFLISFPDERPYEAELFEDPDGNLKLQVEAVTGESRTFSARKMPVYVNDHYEKNLSAKDAIQHYVEFLEA